GTVGGLIVGAIIRHGDRPAICDGSVTWSYRELGDAIGRFVSVFKAMGLKKGDALSILAGNRAESWAAMCAGLVMGMRYTPLHPLAA
ncbi:AMP-binding protein, partial [Acinetobacter baumannii]